MNLIQRQAGPRAGSSCLGEFGDRTHGTSGTAAGVSGQWPTPFCWDLLRVGSGRAAGDPTRTFQENKTSARDGSFTRALQSRAASLLPGNGYLSPSRFLPVTQPAKSEFESFFKKHR